MGEAATMTPAGARILAAARALFYERGIHRVGVELVAAEAEVTKKTLYDRFGSKDGLVLAYLRDRRERWQSFVEQRLEESPEAGDDRVVVVLDALADWMADHRRGCGFVNAFAELSGPDAPTSGHPGLEDIRSEKTWVRDLYTRLAAEAGHADAGRLGAQLALLHEGAIVETTAGGSPGALDVARGTAYDLLRASKA